MIKGGISKRCPLFYTPQRGGRALRARGRQRRRRCTNATPIFFPKKENGRRPSKRKAFRLAVSGLKGPLASGMRLPARGVAALALRYDLPLLLSSAVAQRVQRFKIKTANVRGQGVRPLAFLWGFQRGYSLWKENTPFVSRPLRIGDKKQQRFHAAKTHRAARGQ